VGLPVLAHLDYLRAEVDGRRVRHGSPDPETVHDVLELDNVLLAEPPRHEYLDGVAAPYLQLPLYLLDYLAEAAPPRGRRVEPDPPQVLPQRLEGLDRFGLLVPKGVDQGCPLDR